MTSTFTNVSYWANAYSLPADMSHPVTIGHRSYGGGTVTAGKYIYYADTGPEGSGYFIRYDVTSELPWNLGSSWEEVSLASINVCSKTIWEYSGAFFDGRYIYYSPRGYDSHYAIYLHKQELVRYDTTKSFTDPDSWETILVETIVPHSDCLQNGWGAIDPGVFMGVTVNSSYAYYAPYGCARFVRYNKSQPFTSVGSWETVDHRTIGLDAGWGSLITWGPISMGICHDNRYVYYGAYGCTSIIVAIPFFRYDTQGSFTDPDSWEKMDKANVLPQTVDWRQRRVLGCIFDGRYIHYSTDGYSNVITRFDTTKSFTDPDSWETITKVSVGVGTGFEWSDVQSSFTAYKYPYLYGTCGSQDPSIAGLQTRYNTTLPYSSADSWETMQARFVGDPSDHYTVLAPSTTNNVYWDVGNIGTQYLRFDGPLDPPPICWNYTAKYKGSNKLFKTSGPGAFPRKVRVPGNVDKSSGKMIDDGSLIDPRKYEVK